MSATIPEQIQIEQRVSKDAKSILVAYLLWLFAGSFAVHRFYLGQTHSAIAMAGLLVLGVATLPFYGLGLFPLLAWVIWLFVDLFLIPGMVAEYRNAIRDRLIKELRGLANAASTV